MAHGKSTVVKAISGVQTVRFKNELERNITIKLGYANAKIYRCSNPACERPASYRAYGSAKEVRGYRGYTWTDQQAARARRPAEPHVHSAPRPSAALAPYDQSASSTN